MVSPIGMLTVCKCAFINFRKIIVYIKWAKAFIANVLEGRKILFFAFPALEALYLSQDNSSFVKSYIKSPNIKLSNT